MQWQVMLARNVQVLQRQQHGQQRQGGKDNNQQDLLPQQRPITRDGLQGAFQLVHGCGLWSQSSAPVLRISLKRLSPRSSCEETGTLIASGWVLTISRKMAVKAGSRQPRAASA